MKNLKVLSFALLLSVLVIAGCEKANNQEKYSCEGDEVCPIENINTEKTAIEIEDSPTIIINDENIEGDLNGNGEGSREVQLESNEEPSDQPMMRIMVDEDATAEEIENDTTQICENLGGSWIDGTCTLSDGSTIAF